MKTKLLTPAYLNGKQYGYRQSAQRIINKFCANNPKTAQRYNFVVNQIDEGCYEIEVISKKFMKKKQTWKDNVQKVYSSLEELRGYDSIYNIAERAGYDKNDVEAMWEENRVIGGSVFPKDFGLAK